MPTRRPKTCPGGRATFRKKPMPCAVPWSGWRGPDRAKTHAEVKNARWAAGTPGHDAANGYTGDAMPEPVIEQGLAQSLRNVHRGVLATLVVCAAVILSQPARENPAPPPQISAAAIGLTIAVIFLRALGTSKVMSPKRRVFFALGSMLCCGAIGLLGVAAAWQEGTRQIGLGFTLGATILVLRPPAAAKAPRGS